MPRVSVHQIHYLPEQHTALEASFTPYFNPRSAHFNRFETGVFLREYARLSFAEADYIGYVSWKFKQKTGITGMRFLHFVAENPGYDVYFINPFPELEVFRSVWEHGELFHPGLKELVGELFVAKGLRVGLEESHDPETMALCNYWVGNRRFWDEHIAFLRSFDDAVSTLPSASPLKTRLDSPADKSIEAGFYPFIFERLFSEHLAQNHGIRSIRYRYSDAELAAKLNPVYRVLRAGSVERRALRTIIRLREYRPLKFLAAWRERSPSAS